MMTDVQLVEFELKMTQANLRHHERLSLRYEAALREIAEGTSDPVERAREALNDKH